VSAFDTATAVQPVGPGRYQADVDDTWHVRKGANGGVVAAVLLRAMLAEVDDAGRAPRSLTVHYPAAFDAGPVDLAVSIERSGRSMTTASVRAVQNGTPVGLGLAAFSPPWPGADLHDIAMPDVPGPDQCGPVVRPEGAPAFAQHYRYGLAQGAPPFSGGEHAEAAVWMAPEDPTVLDYPLLAALTDAFFPVIFLTQTRPLMVPTVDLTVHFRASLSGGAGAGTGPWLGVFRTRLSAEGFMEEDGEVWSADGVLLAQSRQLALAVPVPA
jgi:acyl-CoA thioesterase